jgi:predicted Zn-dependent protease
MLEIDPNSAPAWVLRSQSERSLFSLPAARAAAERALEIAPADLSVQFNLWSILVAADDPTGAAAFLRDRVLATQERATAPDMEHK